jgi:hypothetical protein
MQCQVQLGLLRETTNHRPTYALLVYVNSSDLSVRQFLIQFDPVIYARCKQRAARIMDKLDISETSPEGYIAGGKECQTCPYARLCGLARIDMPADDDAKLAPELVAEIAVMGREVMRADEQAERASTLARQRKEELRNRLREIGVRKVKGDGISVLWSQVQGRITLDREAMQAAGIDLTKYEKRGASSDRLTVQSA